MRGSPPHFNNVDGYNNRIVVYRKEDMLHPLILMKMEVWKRKQRKLLYADVLLWDPRRNYRSRTRTFVRRFFYLIHADSLIYSSALMMEAIWFSEMFVYFQWTPRRCMPEDKTRLSLFFPSSPMFLSLFYHVLPFLSFLFFTFHNKVTRLFSNCGMYNISHCFQIVSGSVPAPSPESSRMYVIIFRLYLEGGCNRTVHVRIYSPAVERGTHDEPERIQEETVETKPEYCPNICLEGLKTDTKNLKY